MIPPVPGAAIGLDHVGIVGADLGALAASFTDLGFQLTPYATHASGRTANRCVMLRDGGYLELMATVPGQSSATVDRFLSVGPGAHILALEVADEAAALDRLRRAGVAIGEVSITERDAGGAKARFALLLPPDPREGRVLLVRHLTPGVLWRPDNMVHPNGAVALTEAFWVCDAPAEAMTMLSRLAGRPAEPDSAGGYRIGLARGVLRVLPRAAADRLFPGASGAAPLLGVTIAVQPGDGRVVHAGGLAIRFLAVPG